MNTEEEKFIALPFMKWREHLCPESKNILTCFDCEHYLGKMTDETWPDFCDLYTGELWRNYVELSFKEYFRKERLARRMTA